MWSYWICIAVLCSITSAYELGALAQGNRMGSIPLGRSVGDGELDIEGICGRNGVTCQNCSHVLTCVELPGGWLRVPIEVCAKHQTCNAHLGGCTTQHLPECRKDYADHVHSCEQVGIFPDPINCRKFHLCSPPADQPYGPPADHRAVFCPYNYAFNPADGQCSIRLRYGQCDEAPAPECRHVGQSEALKSSAHYYYVCLSKQKKLYPQVFVCPRGMYFWNNFCHESSPPLIRPQNELTTTERLHQYTAQPTTASTFFSTERSSEYPKDTFLADKYDLSNYENKDGGVFDRQVSYEYSSLESF